MLPDDRMDTYGSRHGSGSRRKRRSGVSKRAITTVSAFLAVLAAVGVVMVAKARSSDSTQLSRKPDKPAAAAIAPPKSWKLTFSSDFSGSTLDSKVWATCYPWSPGGCTNFGNNGEEKEWYQPSQVQVNGGVLHLVAKRQPTAGRAQNGTPREYACRSGMVTTDPGFRFTYGYVQVVARVAFGTGLWSAFWLAAANRQWPPEIDLLEHWGTHPFAKVYLHSKSGPRQGGPVKTPNIATGWHTFTLYWTKSRLSWYYDGYRMLSTTSGIPRQAMYFIANLAVYNAGRGGCSGSLDIKSVKVWQP